MAKKRIPELKIELLNDRGNYLYMSLVEYKREQYLCIIDSVKEYEIGAYVLDYAEQENIDLQKLFQLATFWFYSNSDNYPLSVQFAKSGLTQWVAPIYKTFDTSYVSRIVGQAFFYKNIDNTKVKRRRVVPIPEGVEIRFKK
jgi:hypothetical protein